MENKRKTDWKKVGVCLAIGTTALGGIFSLAKRIIRKGIEKEIAEPVAEIPKIEADKSYFRKDILYVNGREYKIGYFREQGLYYARCGAINSQVRIYGHLDNVIACAEATNQILYKIMGYKIDE